MKPRENLLHNPDFYKDIGQTNPSLVLGLTVVTLGLYIINWIYVKNKEFEQLLPDAPNAKRGAVIMMVLPFTWFFIIQITKTFLPPSIQPITLFIEILVYSLIFFLILKYLYDFCNCFGKITKSKPLVWYFFFILGIIGIVGLILNIKLLLPLLIIVFLIIPAMQAELNTYINKLLFQKTSNVRYH